MYFWLSYGKRTSREALSGHTSNWKILASTKLHHDRGVTGTVPVGAYYLFGLAPTSTRAYTRAYPYR